MNLAWTNRALAASLFALAMGLGAGCANGNADTCDPACPTFHECCGASDGVACRDVVNDPNNCGGCGVTCPSGMCREARCVPGTAPVDGGMIGTDSGSGGNCSPSCSAEQRCCGSTCISRNGVALGTNGQSDPSFSACSGCGIACDPQRASACSVPGGGSGNPRCMCGVEDQCPTGQLCVPQAGSFTCVSTGNDPNNCGGVGIRCAMGESCNAGTCQCGTTGAACVTGQACCSTGCVDLQSDAMNCGACGNACDAGETCQAGACVCGSGPTARACAEPMAGILGSGGSPGESCCDGECVANTDASCACETCSGEDTCQVSGGLGIPGLPGGGAVEVCCGDGTVALLGCGGGGGFPGLGDGGLPFP